MTIGALLVLEVNLRLPPGSNMITMAKSTLGLPGQIIAWISYLLLLYSLLSAYIAGGSDIFQAILLNINIKLPNSATSVIYTGLFSLVVYSGIQAVDYVNRGLMFGKLGIYILLVLIISPHVNLKSLHQGSLQTITASFMILIASFGFASIVPSLREYLHSDRRALRKVIVLGSLIPLTCYIIWNAIIMGVIPREGDNGLIALNINGHTTSGLILALSKEIHNEWIDGFFSFFSSICMVTAFLGVSIGLFDFLADGLKLRKSGVQGKSTLALTFLPPLTIALFYPGIYLHALSYAGICCVILLLLLPAVMSWQARRANPDQNLILVPGGYVLLTGMILTGLYLLTLAI